MTLGLTPQLAAAVNDTQSGATEVARQVIDGLTILSGDRRYLEMTAEAVAEQLPWCAPMWHVVRAAASAQPQSALCALRKRLDFTTDQSVAAAVRLLRRPRCAIRTARGSDVVARVVELLPPGPCERTVGVVGVDAISPTSMLNAIGTTELASSVPTLIVASSLKAVPQGVFDTMDASGFERVPLSLFETVVLDGEVLNPGDAGSRIRQLTA